MQTWKKPVVRAAVALIDAVRSAPAAPRREYILGARADARVDCVHVLPLSDIVYVFLGSEPSLRMIRTQWARDLAFEENWVYVRTAKGIFHVFADRVNDVEERMGDFDLAAINRSLSARMEHIRALDPTGLVFVQAGSGMETLQAGQRDFEKLLRRCGGSRHVFR